MRMRQKSARFRTKKRNPCVSKLNIFQNGTSRIRYRLEFAAAEIWRVSAHELNFTIVESYFEPNKFREYFISKHLEKTLIAKGKQISSKIMIFRLLWTSKLIFIIILYYICPFCRSRVFMRINIRLSFDCMHFTCFVFFAFVWNYWSKPPYVALHLNQQPSEPAYLKNDGIKITLLKKFLLITKSETTMSAWSFNFVLSWSWGTRSAGLN